MLQLVPGIGPIREQHLRSIGVSEWRDLLRIDGQMSLLPSRMDSAVLELEDRYAAEDVRFFYRLLPRRLSYLLALEFPHLVSFVDIKSTGLSRVYHTVTLVGWLGGDEYSYELVGRHGEISEEFLAGLSSRPLVVTFNGSLFDLPFLGSIAEMPDIASIDLRYLCFRFGYPGSQKVVEADLSISRPNAYSEVRGEDAPALWFKATRGDIPSLRRLVYYNFLDVRGMVRILKKVGRLALQADLTVTHKEVAEVSRAVGAAFQLPRVPQLLSRDLSAHDLTRESSPLLAQHF